MIPTKNLYRAGAGWIRTYTADQQAVINALTLDKSNAFTAVSTNPIVAWYKCEPTYLTLATLAITQMLDAGGRGNHTAVQGTAAARPTYDATGINSLGVATGDGGDSLSLPAAMYTLPTGSFTIIGVWKRASEDATNDALFGFGVAGVQRTTGFYSATAGTVSFRSKTANTTSISSTGNTNTNFAILHFRRSGTTQEVGVNNITPVTDTNAAGVPSVDSATLFTGGSFPFTGSLAEVFFLDISATSAQILALKTYLATKYAITI